MISLLEKRESYTMSNKIYISGIGSTKKSICFILLFTKTKKGRQMLSNDYITKLINLVRVKFKSIEIRRIR